MAHGSFNAFPGTFWYVSVPVLSKVKTQAETQPETKAPLPALISPAAAAAKRVIKLGEMREERNKVLGSCESLRSLHSALTVCGSAHKSIAFTPAGLPHWVT